MYTIVFMSENIKYTNRSFVVDTNNVKSKMSIKNTVNYDISYAVCEFRSETHHHVRE